MEIKSTYNLRTDFSFRGEKFFSIPLTWRLGVSNIELLKIRVAGWKPKSNRSNQAIFYFDVKTKDDAFQILEKVKDFNFKKIQNYYESITYLEKYYYGLNPDLVDKGILNEEVKIRFGTASIANDIFIGGKSKINKIIKKYIK